MMHNGLAGGPVAPQGTPRSAPERNFPESGRQPAGRVLLLAPSRGQGGGIERYLTGLEGAFTSLEVPWQRLDLSRGGVRAHRRLLVTARAALHASPQPARLVAAHRSLLPVAVLLARETTVHGISVLCHGSDAWDTRLRPRSVLERHLMRRPGVRVVAVSGFTAGTLANGRHASVLPPSLPPEWFRTLVRAAGGAPQDQALGARILTVFRLADWRDKGLPELAQAVTALGQPGIRLTVCGSGSPPSGLRQLVARHRWCELRTGLSDAALAHEFARADVFVLATRTRRGRRACGEGFGMVLLEAQVAGTPVIAPAYGGSHDAYVEGVTGAAPANESAQELTQALRYLLRDRDRLAWMGRRAAGWARETFDPERYPGLVARKLL
jgi:glycosyltransferase involved in cell wall biosynthesis